MKRIFISHSSRDGETARSLCDTLESLGYPCWIAPRDISYGEMWAERIADSLILDLYLAGNVVKGRFVEIPLDLDVMDRAGVAFRAGA